MILRAGKQEFVFSDKESFMFHFILCLLDIWASASSAMGSTLELQDFDNSHFFLTSPKQTKTLISVCESQDAHVF